MLKLINRNILLLLYVIAAFIINLVAYYPGFMSPDTLDQYEQAVTNNYHDWHPPLIAYVWSILNKVKDGPSMMLVIQLLFYWVSIFLIAKRVQSKTIIVVLLLSLTPFIHNYSGYIGKDVQMSFSWLLAIALIFSGNNKKSNEPVVASLALFFIAYGTLLRINALTGAIPLIILYSFHFQKSKKLIVKVSNAVVIIIVIGLVQHVVIPKALNVTKRYPQSKLYFHDITGIYKETGISYFPEKLVQSSKVDTAGYKDLYHTATFDNLWWGEHASVKFKDFTQEEINNLRSSWLKATKNHPATYLQNRWDGFLYYLRIKKRRPDYTPYYVWIHPNDYGFNINEDGLYKFVTGKVNSASGSFTMRPWFWLLMNILLFIPITFLKNSIEKNLVVTLLFSSLMYLIPHFFVYQVDTDFRYFYWTCIAVSFSFMFLINHFLRKRIK